MTKKDPIQRAEELLKRAHHETGRHAKPVLSRYPVLFSFLVVIGILSVQYGFEKIIDKIDFLKEHPGYLVIFGFAILFATGTLFKSLGKVK